MGRWVSAARHGLADRVLQRAAIRVFELAVAALPALGPPSWLVDDLAAVLEQRVRRGLCPADLSTPAPDAAPVPHAPVPNASVPNAPAPIGDPEEARA